MTLGSMTKILAAVSLLILSACSNAVSSGYCPLPADKLVLFGDSVGAGYGVGPRNSFGALAADQLKIRIDNYAVSGHTTGRALDIVQNNVGRVNKRDLVVVEIGGNDFLRGYDQDSTVANLEKILSAIKVKTPNIVLVAVPEKSKSAALGFATDSPIYAQLAQKYDVVLMPDSFSQTLSDSKLKIDLIHPNEKGHQKMAQDLIQTITQACKSRPVAR